MAPSPPSEAKLSRRNSSDDALSGDPRWTALASASAGFIQATMLLPINTIQTQMQTRGLNVYATVSGNFERGLLGGIRSLYRALGPTIGMLGLRNGIKFGSGTAFKQRLPESWPEWRRDMLAGGFSAHRRRRSSFRWTR